MPAGACQGKSSASAAQRLAGWSVANRQAGRHCGCVAHLADTRPCRALRCTAPDLPCLALSPPPPLLQVPDGREGGAAGIAGAGAGERRSTHGRPLASRGGAALLVRQRPERRTGRMNQPGDEDNHAERSAICRPLQTPPGRQRRLIRLNALWMRPCVSWRSDGDDRPCHARSPTSNATPSRASAGCAQLCLAPMTESFRPRA